MAPSPDSYVGVLVVSGIVLFLYALMTFFIRTTKDIQYARPEMVLVMGEVTTENTLTSRNFQPSSFTVSPSLPTGLTFGISTGTISGTPTVAQERTPYVVKAFDFKSNSASTNVYITVLAP